MAQMIHKQLANQIVNTLKSICEHDINFIDVNGKIYASTDKVRVGNYHSIGYQAAKTGKTIAVEEENFGHGTKKGINMPVRFHGETIAVIGITGPPDEVKRYALLAQRITLLLLREHEMDIMDRNRQSQVRFAVLALTKNQDIHQDFLTDIFQENNLDLNDTKWRTILIKPGNSLQQTDPSAMESAIIGTFEKIGQNLHTFDYPREYLAIAQEDNLRHNMFHLRRLADRYGPLIKIGIGSCQTLRRQHISCEAARITLASLEEDKNIACFDELDLQILLADTAPNVRSAYLEKALGGLSEEDLNVLQAYYQSEMALKKTAETLYIHQNTLQYRLNRIRQICGYDPRNFKDAVILYIGLRIRKNRELNPPISMRH